MDINLLAPLHSVPQVLSKIVKQFNLKKNLWLAQKIVKMYFLKHISTEKDIDKMLQCFFKYINMSNTSEAFNKINQNINSLINNCIFFVNKREFSKSEIFRNKTFFVRTKRVAASVFSDLIKTYFMFWSMFIDLQYGLWKLIFTLHDVEIIRRELSSFKTF